MTDLKSLLERVEKASSPDRELDARLWCMAEGSTFSHVTGFEGAIIHFPPGAKGASRESGYPEYTASLDAALALVERVLPGWKWFASFGYADSDGGPFYAMVRAHGHVQAEPTPHAGSPALAILTAMLKALDAQAARPPTAKAEGR